MIIPDDFLHVWPFQSSTAPRQGAQRPQRPGIRPLRARGGRLAPQAARGAGPAGAAVEGKWPRPETVT